MLASSFIKTPALCVNDTPLTPTPLRDFHTHSSSSMHERPTQLSVPNMTIKNVKENQTSTESSETGESTTSLRHGQKRIGSPIPHNPNRYKKVASEGDSGYDLNVETLPPKPRWFTKVTSMEDCGYWSLNTGQLPRKTQKWCTYKDSQI